MRNTFRKFSYAGLIPLLMTTPTAAEEGIRERFGEECYQALHDESPMDPELRSRCLLRWRDLPQLTITATRREEDVRDVPAAVTVISSQQIERQGIESLAEALRDIPGVDITDAGQGGLKRIRIRGEESKRVAILIDGQEFFDPHDVGTPLLLSPEMIERVEVIRGNASVLHGSRAIGGVVNFVTKKGGYHPVQATVSGLYDSATKGGQGFSSLYGRLLGLEYRVAGALADHGDRHTPDGDVENTSFENESYYTYLAKNWEDHSLEARFEDFNASSEVYVEPEVRFSPPFLDFRIDAPQRDRSKAALFYDGSNLGDVLTKVPLDTYYQWSERQFNTFSDTRVLIQDTPTESSTAILNDSTLDTLGANFQLDISVLDENQVVAGMEFQHNDLQQERLRSVVRNGQELPRELVSDDAAQWSIEPFFQDQWAFAKDWQGTGGIRAYWISNELESTTRPGLETSSSDDHHVVGSVSLKYTGLGNSTIWASWSQGFVAPSLTNIATGAFAGPDFVNPNPELNPETSSSWEVGSRFQWGDLSVDAASFFTVANDLINHTLCSNTSAVCLMPTSSRDRVFVNVDKARSFGAEVSAEFELQFVRPYGSLSWIRRRYESMGLRTYETGIPEVTGRIGLEASKLLNPKIYAWSDLYLRVENGSDEIDGAREIHKSGWGTLNVVFGVDLGLKQEVKVVLDLQNLFDKRYISSAENLVARGRSAILKTIIDI